MLYPTEIQRARHPGRSSVRAKEGRNAVEEPLRFDYVPSLIGSPRSPDSAAGAGMQRFRDKCVTKLELGHERTTPVAWAEWVEFMRRFPMPLRSFCALQRGNNRWHLGGRGDCIRA